VRARKDIDLDYYPKYVFVCKAKELLSIIGREIQKASK
jgi:hypothetical protein